MKETLAYPDSKMCKRAALLFDRLYIGLDRPREEVPVEVQFLSQEVDERWLASLQTQMAYMAAGLMLFVDGLRDPSQEDDGQGAQGNPEYFARMLRLLGQNPQWHADILHLRTVIEREGRWPSSLQAAGRMIARLQSHTYRVVLDCGHPVVPLFPSWAEYDQVAVEGSSVAFEAALGSIPSILEDELSWDQVLEFRKDAEAKRKLRALRSWLQTGLNASSVAEAREQIERKVDDYEWAIRKHGLKSVTGGLTSILDSKFLASVAGTGGIGALMGGPIWAAIAAGALTLSRISVWMVERKIELLDVERGPGSEVALICDTRKMVQGRADPAGAK